MTIKVIPKEATKMDDKLIGSTTEGISSTTTLTTTTTSGYKRLVVEHDKEINTW